VCSKEGDRGLQRGYEDEGSDGETSSEKELNYFIRQKSYKI